MEELINLITNQGYAIAISSYVIIVVNKSLQEMTKVMTVLVEKLDRMEEKK